MKIKVFKITGIANHFTNMKTIIATDILDAMSAAKSFGFGDVHEIIVQEADNLTITIDALDEIYSNGRLTIDEVNRDFMHNSFPR